MRKATKIVTAALAAAAGIGGIEHGVFEILRENTRPDGLVIASIGPPCDPETAWNACEPALTILPSYLLTGILATFIGLVILVWSLGFVHRKHGGLVLILLSVALLLCGGGFFPPLIGFVGGLAGTRIYKPLPAHAGGRALTFLAALWPWPLIVFLVWTFGQIAVGYFFNDFLQRVMIFGVLLIVTTLVLSVLSANAVDVVGQQTGQPAVARRGVQK